VRSQLMSDERSTRHRRNRQENVIKLKSVKPYIPRKVLPIVRSAYRRSAAILTPMTTLLENVYYFLADTTDALTGRRDALVPPRRKIFVGAGDFRRIGEEFLRFFIELGRLKPNEKVLDVGCGIGRMAIPLTRYLNEDGEYEGFDVAPEGIKWCRAKITPRHPNFRFHLADIYNEWYNPGGKFEAADYKFSYEDESFDFVFLTSVFTHLLPRDMENYLSEIARVLKKDGGRCLITFFLLNPESLSLISAGRSTLDFRYRHETYRTVDENVPELAIAYDEQFVKDLYKKYGLCLVEIQRGAWCGREDFLTYQDVVVAEKSR